MRGEPLTGRPAALESPPGLCQCQLPSVPLCFGEPESQNQVQVNPLCHTTSPPAGPQEKVAGAPPSAAMAMYYTKQELQGAGRYSGKCRIGNWNENDTLDEVRAATRGGPAPIFAHAYFPAEIRFRSFAPAVRVF